MIAELVYLPQFRLWFNGEFRIVVVLDYTTQDLILQPPIKVERLQVKLSQLITKQVHVPFALVALVVYETQRGHLLRRKLVHAHAGDGFHAEFLCRQHTAVADNDNAIFVYHNRLDKTILPDALRYVADLPLVMLLRVVCIGDDLPNRYAPDLHMFLSSIKYLPRVPPDSEGRKPLNRGRREK